MSVQLDSPFLTLEQNRADREIKRVPRFRPEKLRSHRSTRASFIGSSVQYKKSEKAGGNIRHQSLNDFQQGQPALQGNEDLGFGDTFQVRSSILEEPKSLQMLSIGRESVAQWKGSTGRKKDWRKDRSTDPAKNKNCLRRNCQWCQKHITECLQVWITSNLRTHDSTICATVRAANLPRSFLKSLESRKAVADLNFIIRAQINLERKAESYHEYSRFGCSQLSRREKRKNRNKMKDLYDVSDSGEFKSSDTGLEDYHASIKAISSNEYWYASQNYACETVRKTSQRDADDQVLTVPYESHIGAFIGNRYVLRSLVDKKPCCEIYDVHVHDAFSFNTNMHLIAKAYSIRGTKGRERDARVKNLKRNITKPSLVDMIDQNGKKWLFFRNSSYSVIEKNVRRAVPEDWLGQEKYHLHFPGLSPCHKILPAPEGRYLMSYASCLHSGQVDAKNRFKGKNQRARNRQQRKRKEERLAKALMFGSTKAKESTPDRNCSLADDSNSTSTHYKFYGPKL
ncbi:MAG: hypothetical protein Q9214_002194 [Letrouitia sp. 1 TL-2023]